MAERDPKAPVTDKEADDIEERSATAPRIVHEAIRKQGEEELGRPALSLLWSGLAGGIGISASILGMAMLESALPEAPWRVAVSSIGYTLGYLVVILGRLQLFTESTLSAVIPLAAEPSLANLARLGRLWGLVLLANLAGTFVIAVLIHHGWIGTPDIAAEMLAVSRKIQTLEGWGAMAAAVPAGFLMAAVAWSLPVAQRQEFLVVLFFTYFIGLGGFAHVVAGAGEAWLLWLAGEATLGWAVFEFLLPTLAGNVLGGSVLFALLAHAQVHAEL